MITNKGWPKPPPPKTPPRRSPGSQTTGTIPGSGEGAGGRLRKAAGGGDLRAASPRGQVATYGIRGGPPEHQHGNPCVTLVRHPAMRDWRGPNKLLLVIARQKEELRPHMIPVGKHGTSIFFIPRNTDKNILTWDFNNLLFRQLQRDGEGGQPSPHKPQLVVSQSSSCTLSSTYFPGHLSRSSILDVKVAGMLFSFSRLQSLKAWLT
jgi:hypothetical protein